MSERTSEWSWYDLSGCAVASRAGANGTMLTNEVHMYVVGDVASSSAVV